MRISYDSTSSIAVFRCRINFTANHQYRYVCSSLSLQKYGKRWARPFCVKEDTSFRCRPVKMCKQDGILAAEVSNVVHATWKMKQRSPFRWGPVNTCNDNTISDAGGGWQTLLTVVGRGEEEVRFAWDQRQFAINYPTQISSLN